VLHVPGTPQRYSELSKRTIGPSFSLYSVTEFLQKHNKKIHQALAQQHQRRITSELRKLLYVKKNSITR
jgi:hypothetical protein